MSLDVADIATKMLDAFQSELSDKWPDMKDYAESESKKMAENFALIERLRMTGKITEEQAKLYLQIQTNATRIVFLTVEGLGLLAVEQAINAAFDVLRETVNGALDFALL